MSLVDLNQSEGGRGSFFLKQSANIYSMMLIISLLAIIIGCLFMFLEWKAYDLHTTVPSDAKAPQAMWSPASFDTYADADQFDALADSHAARIAA